jgi:hypothetical protein
MGGGDERAQIVIAGLVLGIERQPVERKGPVGTAGARERQHRSDDRLDALFQAGVGERHRRVEAVPVGQRHGRKIQPFGMLGDRRRLDRAVQHGVAGEDTKRDVRRGHRSVMVPAAPLGKRSSGLFHT